MCSVWFALVRVDGEHALTTLEVTLMKCTACTVNDVKSFYQVLNKLGRSA
jgi:hypothetical protein